jgi:hypothetical protein
MTVKCGNAELQWLAVLECAAGVVFSRENWLSR